MKINPYRGHEKSPVHLKSTMQRQLLESESKRLKAEGQLNKIKDNFEPLIKKAYLLGDYHSTHLCMNVDQKERELNELIAELKEMVK